MSDYPLVMITWLDSRQTDGAWQWLSQFKKLTPMEVVSVGWLIQDDAQVKVLAQSMAPAGQSHADGIGLGKEGYRSWAQLTSES